MLFEQSELLPETPLHTDDDDDDNDDDVVKMVGVLVCGINKHMHCVCSFSYKFDVLMLAMLIAEFTKVIRKERLFTVNRT